MRADSRRPARGMTTIEMAVSLAIISSILWITGAALSRSFASTSELNRTNASESRAEVFVERVAAALADAGRTSLSACAPPAGASALDFRCASGFASEAVTWQAPQRIEWVVNPSDSTMGSVVWTRDVGLTTQTSVTIATNVPALAPGEIANSLDDDGNGLVDEKGLSFSRTGNALRVRISVKRSSAAGTFVTVTSERTIALRN